MPSARYTVPTFFLELTAIRIVSVSRAYYYYDSFCTRYIILLDHDDVMMWYTSLNQSSSSSSSRRHRLFDGLFACLLFIAFMQSIDVHRSGWLPSRIVRYRPTFDLHDSPVEQSTDGTCQSGVDDFVRDQPKMVSLFFWIFFVGAADLFIYNLEAGAVSFFHQTSCDVI